jgi:hypothetical protein
MKKVFYKSIEEVPQELILKYHAGKYRFNPPPVYSGNWDELAWINWVVFDVD